MTLKKKKGPNTHSNPGNSKKSSSKTGTKSRGEMRGSFNGVGYFMMVIFLGKIWNYFYLISLYDKKMLAINSDRGV